MAEFQHSTFAPFAKTSAINALARRSFIGGAAIVAMSANAIDCFAPSRTFVPAASFRAAWDAAVANAAHYEAAFEATGDDFTRTEALYWSMRPERPTNEDLLTHYTGPIQPGQSIFARGAAIKADYEQRDRLAKQQSGHDEAAGARDAAMHLATAATEALIACPAPDLAAVAYKIELARNECMDLEDIAPVLADLRRLMGEAA
jgi:hypothetical protein